MPVTSRWCRAVRPMPRHASGSRNCSSMGCCVSFVPPPPIRELRDLTRYRKTVIEERTRELQRVQKPLEDPGIKLSSVASSHRRRVRPRDVSRPLTGSVTPTRSPSWPKRRCAARPASSQQALTGRFGAHHAILAREMLARIDAADATCARLSTQISSRLEPFRDKLDLLMMIRASLGAPLRSSLPRPAATCACSVRRTGSPPGLACARQQRVRRQAPPRTHPPGHPMDRNGADRSGQRRRPSEGDLPVRAVPPPGRRGSRKRATVAVAHSILVDRLPPARPERALPRPRRRLLRPAVCPTTPTYAAWSLNSKTRPDKSPSARSTPRPA